MPTEREKAQAQFEFMMLQKQKAQKAEDNNEPWYEDFAEGLAVSAMEPYYGIKDLSVGLDEDDRATLADWKKDASQSGWGTAGQVVGEIGQLAIPGGAAFKGVKALSAAKNLSKGLTRGLAYGADAGIAGLHAGVKLPQENESRLVNAAKGAALSGIGSGVMTAGGKLVRGINKTPEAKQLLAKGWQGTPGQVSEGGLPETAEQLLNWFTSTAKSVEKARERSSKSFSKIVLNEAAPPGYTISKGADAGNKELSDAFTDAYAKAWSKVKRPNNAGFISVINAGIRGGSRLHADSQRVIANNLQDVNDLSRHFTKEKITTLDKNIRQDIVEATSNRDFHLADTLKEMRDALREGMNPSMKKELEAIDKQYPKFLAVVQAATGDTGAKLGGLIEPHALRMSGNTVSGRAQTFAGNNPLRGLADLGRVTLGRNEMKPLIDMRKAIVKNLPSPTRLLERAEKGVLGDLAIQKAGREYLSPIANALRQRGLSGSALTAGTVGAQD